MLNIDDISRGTNAIPAAIHSAMEEYALQEMGSFAEWILKEGYYGDEGVWWTNPYTEMAQMYTTEQILKEYYESIKG